MPAFGRHPYPGREPDPRSFPVGGAPELPGHVRRSDEDIRREIESALFYDDRVNSYQVKVDVKDCIVTLSGTVDSDDEKTVAEEDAMAVAGACEVRSNLVVRPS